MTNDMSHDAQTGDAQRKGWWALILACSGTAADRRNQYIFLGWLFAWAVSFLAATWALKFLDLQGIAAWLLAIAPNVFSIGALFAYLHFLRMADELIRQIQLEGLAFGFGAGAIFAMGYQLMEHAGAPELHVGDPVVVMMVAWALGQLIGMRRYG
ncbi:MAG: hypothetical protein V3R27_03040 [Pseudomonadales bacterium]